MKRQVPERYYRHLLNSIKAAQHLIQFLLDDGSVDEAENLSILLSKLSNELNACTIDDDQDDDQDDDDIDQDDQDDQQDNIEDEN